MAETSAAIQYRILVQRNATSLPMHGNLPWLFHIAMAIVARLGPGRYTKV